MNGFAICAIVILVLTAAALVVLARQRRRYAEKRIRIAIVNDGNVPGSYQLRAEGAEGELGFRFSLLDEDLPRGLAQPEVREKTPPPKAPATQPKPGGEARKAAGRALGIGGAIADGLVALGQLLPRSARGPVMQLASRMRGGQMAAMRVQRVPTQVARVRSSKLRPKPPRTTIAAEPEPSEPGWVLTPAVPPGETLALELHIRALQIKGGVRRPFAVISRSVEAGDGKSITREGVAGFAGSFWARRWLPYVTIAATAIVLLLVAFGLANAGLFG